ncbi:hypothetical protein AMTRI_Chr12g270260 [Amborella trichopoda]
MFQTTSVTAAHQSQAKVGQHLPQVSTHLSMLGNPPTGGPTIMPNTQQDITIKEIQDMLLRMGMHEILPLKAYVQETLGGMEDLPPRFVILEFRNKFNEKSDSDIHVNAYLLSVRALRDRPNQLKALFSQTLTDEALNWHRRIMTSQPHIPPDKIFNQFVSHYCRSTPRSLSLGELSATKQNPGKSFEDFIGRFREVAMRVIECPLADPAKISMALENSTPEYMTFFNRGIIPHSFDFMIERLVGHERARGTPLNTRPNSKLIMTPQNKCKSNSKGNVSSLVNEVVINGPAQGSTTQHNNRNQNRRV